MLSGEDSEGRGASAGHLAGVPGREDRRLGLLQGKGDAAGRIPQKAWHVDHGHIRVDAQAKYDHSRLASTRDGARPRRPARQEGPGPPNPAGRAVPVVALGAAGPRFLGVRGPGRILAVRNHPGADPQGVWDIVQPAHAAEDAAQDQVPVQETQTRSIQLRPGGRAGGVREAHICRSGQAGRARICRARRGRGAPAAVRGGRLRMVSHQRKRVPDGILNSVRQDVRDPGKGRTSRAGGRSHEPAHVRGLSKVGAPEISKTRVRLDSASYHKSGTVMDYPAYVNGDIRLVFLPPYTPQLSPTGILWGEIKWPLSCRYFESEEDLERAITETVGGGGLKAVKTMDYLAARDTVCGRLSGCFLGIPAPQYDAGLQFLNCCRLIFTRSKSPRRRTFLAMPDSCRILMPRCRIFMVPTMRKRWTSACRS